MQAQDPPAPIQLLGNAGDYELYTKLGDGGQAVVFAGSKNFQLYAVKIYHPGPSRQAAFRQEVDFLRNLNFPHLINLVDFTPNATIRLENRPDQTRNILVQQIADGFQIFQYIARLGRFPPEICRYYVKQLISTLKYLVAQNVAHRDIKPENILLDSHFNIKLSDFGLACDARGDFGDYKLRDRVGTEGYRPPQMEDSNYTGYQADLFAIGVVLFIMYKGLPPFLSTRPHDRTYRLIRQNNFAKFWQSHERNLPANFFTMPFKRLMNAFLAINPNQRHTFQTLEQDQWLNDTTATPQEVLQYMQQKYNQLFQNNKIKEVRKALLKQKIQHQLKCKEREKPIIGEQDRYEEDEQSIQSLSLEERFVKTYSLLNIKLDDLPELNKKKVIYVNEDPNFVVSWIKDFITLSFKDNQKFLKDFVEDISPKQFFFSFDKKKLQIELTLEFNITDQQQTSGTQLKLNGKLHKSKKGEVGVEWHKQIGNFYWLSAIQSKINQSLQKIQ